jgi:RNA polymerase sigma-70 factor (ECF subfamily)
MPTPSAELVRGLVARDPRVFRVVYEQYRARLYSFLLRLTGDESLARDLSQETWLRLSANASRLLPDTQLGAWLFTVARNLYVSHRRWSFLSRARLRDLRFWSDAHTSPESQASELLSAHRAEQALSRALLALPTEQREVVLLVSVEGFSTLEVARMLDLEHATVRKRLSRARAALKRAMPTEEEP